MHLTNSDNLFVSNTAAEVRAMEKQIKETLEQKKEDLRQTVGRRYRDIIDAADNIRTMTSMIHTSLGELHGGMQRLDERQQELSASLYRVQPNANTSQQHWLGYVRTVFDVHICSGSQHSLEAWPSIAIMHLMAIDEMICQCIDGADAELPMAMCCDAVWLVTLCDAIRSSLSTSVLTPAASHICSSTNRRNEIPCTTALRRHNATSDELCDALAAWALLSTNVGSGDIDVRTVCKRFVDERKIQLRNCMPSSAEGGDGAKTLREQMVASAVCVQATIMQVHALFDGGGVLARLAAAGAPTYQPAVYVDYLQCQSSATLRAAPRAVHKFCMPFVNLVNVERAMLTEMIAEWLQFATQTLVEPLRERLQFIDSMPTLAQLKRQTINALEPLAGDYSLACTSLLGDVVDVWTCVFASEVDARCTQLTRACVADAFVGVRVQLTAACKNTSQLRALTSCSLFDWEVRVDEQSTSITLGICAPVQQWARQLSAALSAVADALHVYIGGGTGTQSSIGEAYTLAIANEFDKWSQTLTRLMDEEAGASGEDYTRRVLLEYTVYDVMISAQLGVGKSSPSTPTGAGDVSIAHRPLLHIYLRRTVAEVLTRMAFADALLCADDVYIAHVHNWSTHELRDEHPDAPGEHVTSTVRAPAAVSAPLQRMLVDLTRILHYSLPVHAVDSESQRLFVDYLLNALCAVYSRLADGDVQQHRMLAALFDCRSLAAMFSALSQRKSVKALDVICTQIEARIDPFDMTTLRPFIHANAQRAAANIHALLGATLPSECTAWAVRAARSAAGVRSTTGGSEHSQLLPTAPVDTPRLPSLPVAQITAHAPLAAAHTGDKTATNITTASKSVKPAARDLTASMSAASFTQFYDKISTSWFNQ